MFEGKSHLHSTNDNHHLDETTFTKDVTEPTPMRPDIDWAGALGSEQKNSAPIQGKGLSKSLRPDIDWSKALGDNQANPGSGSDSGKKLDVSKNLSTSIQEGFGLDTNKLSLLESPNVAKMGARATTQGNVISFAPGEYQPETKEGQKLIGHELNHVREQAKGNIRANVQDTNIHYDAGHETSSDRAGEAFASGALSKATPVPIGDNVGGTAVQAKMNKGALAAAKGAKMPAPAKAAKRPPAPAPAKAAKRPPAPAPIKAAKRPTAPAAAPASKGAATSAVMGGVGAKKAVSNANDTESKGGNKITKTLDSIGCKGGKAEKISKAFNSIGGGGSDEAKANKVLDSLGCKGGKEAKVNKARELCNKKGNKATVAAKKGKSGTGNIQSPSTANLAAMSTTSPAALQVNTTSPAALQVNTTSPAALQVNTTSPAALQAEGPVGEQDNRSWFRRGLDRAGDAFSAVGNAVVNTVSAGIEWVDNFVGENLETILACAAMVLSPVAFWGYQGLSALGSLTDSGDAEAQRERILENDGFGIHNYRGQIVFNLPFMGGSGMSLGPVMFLGSNASENTLSHEHGHFQEYQELGLLRYLTGIGLPSVINANRDNTERIPGFSYNNQPWERHADTRAGVVREREHTDEAGDLSEVYMDHLRGNRSLSDRFRFLTRDLPSFINHDFSPLGEEWADFAPVWRGQ